MRVPNPPPVRPIASLSLTAYEALTRCPARCAWTVADPRPEVPVHPAALLGTCFHVVIAASHRGQLSQPTEDERRDAARVLFDREARARFERTHPLVQAKFASAERLPGYNLARERAALRAAATPPGRGRGAAAGGTRTHVEDRLASADGTLHGRPDYIDAAVGEVVDYKTGTASETEAELSEAELRQLRLYVHLARENGLAVGRATIVRGNGRRLSIEVTEADAAEEGRRARSLLRTYNEHAAGRSFAEVATPSTEACDGCPCVPFCEPFWAAAGPAWSETDGAPAGARRVHVEARIEQTSTPDEMAVPLMGLEVVVLRGTAAPGPADVEHAPQAWLSVGGTGVPQVGETVRMVSARLLSGGERPVLRLDRATTAVWQTPAGDGEVARERDPIGK